ncbi:WxL domain-containing protein [Companilactobacillus sp. HBUAS59699]|uniref:WxL domain-containing protein n=1 Tax=Companilactobacillus sp. HBUAS59699 TaxID=3109358 RepID=UPI002FF2FEA0
MKLSKNVLVGSLASAGMVLGLVAPATTAFAATGSFEQQEDGTVVSKATTGTLNSSNYIAIADSDTKAEGDATGASAKSNVNVDVISGLLVLKDVPNLGFGSAVAGQKNAKLVDNNAEGDNNDGDNNPNGDLTVQDSRADQPGFKLTASLGSFTGGPSKGGFVLTLNPTDIANDADGVTVDPAATAQKTSEAILSDTGAAGTVMNMTKGSYKAGAVTAQFHTPADASLAVPTDAQGTNAVTSYKSTITWTLAAAPEA